MKILRLFTAVGLLLLADVSLGGATLDNVKEKGFVQCGVTPSLPGFSNADDAGEWTGLGVETFFEEFWQKAPHRGTKGIAERQRPVAKDVLPVIGTRAAADITRPDLMHVLEIIAARGAGVAADRTSEVLRAYNRASMDGPAREAWLQWGSTLLSDNVVSLRRRAGTAA